MKLLIKDLLKKITELEVQIRESEITIRSLSKAGKDIEDHTAKRIADYVVKWPSIQVTRSGEWTEELAQDIRKGRWIE